MKKAILATKLGMTQVWNADGELVPVTVLEAGPCVVTQIKTIENDGYEAVQVGFGDKPVKVVTKDAAGRKSVAHRHGINKPVKGHLDKAGVSPKRSIREFKGTGNMELHLSRRIAEKRVYPAVDVNRSGTRHDELLQTPAELQKVWILRKFVHDMDEVEAAEFLIEHLSSTKTNEEFFDLMKSGKL